MAILFILLCHYVGNAFSVLWVGVDLFFVLSGFLITRILLRKSRDEHYFRNFYLRRTLRIFPLYYFALVLVLFILPSVMISLDISYLREKQAWFWLYMENWLFAFEGWPRETNIIISHFWSLAIEEQYYLMWPLVVYFLRNRVGLLAVVTVLLAGIALGLRLSGTLGNPGFYTITFARMDSLLTGSFVAVAAMLRPETLKLAARRLVWPLAGIIIGVITTSSDLSYSNRFFSTIGYTVLAVFFGAVVVLSFRQNTPLRRLLDCLPLKVLGRYSYGLYVFHFPVYWLFRPALMESLSVLNAAWAAKVVAALALLLFTFALTLFSYHLLELPFLRLKRFFE